MAASDIKNRINQALASPSVRLMLAEYLKVRHDERKDQLVTANDQNFRAYQGRCAELQTLITEIEEGRLK